MNSLTTSPPMDPDGFNWGVTLYLFKGEYYYYNFFPYQVITFKKKKKKKVKNSITNNFENCFKRMFIKKT